LFLILHLNLMTVSALFVAVAVAVAVVALVEFLLGLFFRFLEIVGTIPYLSSMLAY